MSARLELRWRVTEAEESYKGTPIVAGQLICEYGIVIPLRENDMRREIYNDEGEIERRQDEIFHVFGVTRSSSIGDHQPAYRGAADAPFRDGAHATWDSEVLGGLEVWGVGTDGKRERIEKK